MKKVIIPITIIFIILAIIVKLNIKFEIDNLVYQFIISYKSKYLTNFFKKITILGTFKCCFLIGVIIFLFHLKYNYKFLLFSPILIRLIDLGVKFIINRPRPNILRLVSVSESSFPSGHASLAIVLYGLLIYLIYSKISKNSVKWILILVLVVIILLIGISRIYLGLHYCTDIIGGYLLGFIYLFANNN